MSRSPSIPRNVSERDANLVHELLKKHRGAANAIKSKEIAIATNLSDRVVRLVVKELVEEEGLAIVGSPNPPYGFYFAETREECEYARNSLLSRVASMTKRIDALNNQINSYGPVEGV